MQSIIIHPKTMSYDDDEGLFYITNNVAENDILIYPANENSKIKHIKDLRFAGDVAKDGSDADVRRDLQYNTNLDQDVFISLGNDINYVQEFIKHSDGHLYVLFNSPQHRYPFGEEISSYPSRVEHEATGTI
jgi:hypothetical protein